jgi:hypothetical protein
MAILRHSRIALTMEIYTEVPGQATRDALGKLSGWLDQADGTDPAAAPDTASEGNSEDPPKEADD